MLSGEEMLAGSQMMQSWGSSKKLTEEGIESCHSFGLELPNRATA